MIILREKGIYKLKKYSYNFYRGEFMDIKKISLNEISPHIRLADLVTTTGKQFYVPLRMIYDYEFYFIVEGEIVVKTEDTQVVLGPGDIHFMLPFSWHKRYSNSPKIRYYGIHLTFLK